jgi:hypothetical protein
MLARVYLPPFITALFGGLFIAIGIITFGKPDYFDRLFIGVLIFTAAVCRKNINIVSILVIILLQRLIEESAWSWLQNIYIIRELIYCIALATVVYLWFDPISKLASAVLILLIGAEIYWYITDYPAPELYWHTTLLLTNLLTRYMIFSRTSIVEHYFPGKGESTNLDWAIYKLCAVAAVIQCLALVEYLIRHLLGFNQVLIVYQSYVFLVHSIAIFVIWVTFNESYKQLLPRLLKA